MSDMLILEPAPPVLRRFDKAGDRYYYYISESGEPVFFVSTTSFIKRVLPTSPFLLEWMKKHGEQADTLRDQRACFGTLMHTAFETFLKDGWDFYDTEDMVAKTLRQHQYPMSLSGGWTLELNKAIASVAQWCLDYQVEPLLIEQSLRSEQMGIGCTIDLIAYIIEPKTNERKLIQVDYKSGGIFDSAELQLLINKLIFEENFPALELDGMYSFAPKDFRDKPTYTFKDQTKTRFTPAVLDSLIHVYNALYGQEIATKRYHLFGGLIRPGEQVSNYHTVSNIANAVCC